MKAKILIAAFLVTLVTISPVNAQDANLENESESDDFNFAVMSF